jgi:hypothetical protein
MLRDKRDDFWYCPVCGGEFWRDEKREREAADELRSLGREKKERESMGSKDNPYFFLPHNPREIISLSVGAVKKGGRNKSGRKRKKPPKKRRPTSTLDPFNNL